MGRLIITESEKKRIKSLYGLITEANEVTCSFTSGSSSIEGYETIMSDYGNDHSKVASKMTEIANEIKSNISSEIITDPTACQMALNMIRPGYKEKNSFIVDTNKKTAYLFDPSGKFIASNWVIVGKDEDKEDKEKMKDFVDLTDQQRQDFIKNKLGATEEAAKNMALGMKNSNWIKPGIYDTNISGVTWTSWKNDNLIGGKETEKPNVYALFRKDGQRMTQAIHSLYNQERKNMMDKVSKYKVGDEAIYSDKGINMCMSWGCLNFSPDFIEKLNGIDFSVFVIDSSKKNFYVYNPKSVMDNEYPNQNVA